MWGLWCGVAACIHARVDHWVSMFFQIVAVVGVGVGFKMMQGKQQFELDPAAPWVGDCADKYLRIVLWAHLVATIGVCLVPLFGWFGFPVIAVRLPRALLQLPFRLGCALASSRPESAAQSIYSTGWPLSDGCLVLSCLVLSCLVLPPGCSCGAWSTTQALSCTTTNAWLSVSTDRPTDTTLTSHLDTLPREHANFLN